MSQKSHIDYYSSSKLIEAIKGKQFKTKLTGDIDVNQDILIDAIDYFVDKSKKNILDGHLCLLNENEQVTRIPIETFYNIGISSIILLIDDEQSICHRLNDRDNAKYDIKMIKNLQDDEKKYAKEIANKLDIPIYVIDLSKDSLTEQINMIEVI